MTIKLNVETIKPARVQETEAGAKSYTGRSEFIKALINDTPGLKSNLESDNKETRKTAYVAIKDAVRARYPQNASPVHIEETINAYLERLHKASVTAATTAKPATKSKSTAKRSTKPTTAKAKSKKRAAKSATAEKPAEVAMSA